MRKTTAKTTPVETATATETTNLIEFRSSDTPSWMHPAVAKRIRQEEALENSDSPADNKPANNIIYLFLDTPL